jgi:hypothetical protein
MTNQDAWAQVVKETVVPILKAAGFAKKANTFTRRRGSATQIVEIKASRGNGPSERTYYIEVGFDLDETRALRADTTGNVVVGGQAVAFPYETSRLDPPLRREWRVDAGFDRQAISTEIDRGLRALVAALDPLEGPRHVLERLDLERGFDKIARAQLRYVLGDRAGARRDVEAVCAEFADRQGMRLEQVLKRAGLRDLA